MYFSEESVEMPQKEVTSKLTSKNVLGKVI